ncbi:SDR family NAD(P)-dependent oxidoreductase [Streptomyces muensis]|uniref:SDR family oxidoreductase n=1 Tax=Streptomyces muensis TaxID=1077944 RepID=A0A9X1PRD9_STRM4|nr:SDR family oxidoreductase [Streptomyces muensis]MCF1592117.1 SDR family oxidoreductase [Streptomyces muensis]
MLLQDKVAVVYGAGGAIGGAAARAFAGEGARVFLAGRTAAPLDELAEDVRAAGGAAETAVVDALDEAAVDAFVDEVVARAGRVDVSFNAIGYGDVQQPLMEISAGDFLQPIATAMRSQFLTTRAAARHMTARGSGVILAFGGGGPQTLPGLGGFKIALDALEGLRRQWALELGPHGIRVVTLKSGGVPESIPDGFPGKKAISDSLVEATQLGRTATLGDVGHVAAFVASDLARTLTATDVNISCGAIVD